MMGLQDEKLLRGKAMEMAGILCCSVGKDNCLADANRMMELLVSKEVCMDRTAGFPSESYPHPLIHSLLPCPTCRKNWLLTLKATATSCKPLLAWHSVWAMTSCHTFTAFSLNCCKLLDSRCVVLQALYQLALI